MHTLLKHDFLLEDNTIINKDKDTMVRYSQIILLHPSSNFFNLAIYTEICRIYFKKDLCHFEIELKTI